MGEFLHFFRRFDLFRKVRRRTLLWSCLLLFLTCFQNCSSSFHSLTGGNLESSSISPTTASLVRIPSGGIYSVNTLGHACYFSDWNAYLLSGGAPDLSGVTSISALDPKLVVDGACQAVSPLDQAATNSICNSCISFQVSAPTTVVWPTATLASLPQPEIPDNLYTVVAFPDHLVSYIADQYTYTLSGSTLAGLNIVDSFNPQPAIGPGGAGQFDECGTWIESADLVAGTNSVRGWYHAEQGYCHGETTPHPVKSIAYSFSTDGGQTFTKTGSPHNLILSATASEIAAATNTVPGGNGDFSIVKHGNYYYLFYINAATGTSDVAVASLASGGVPGSWLKWYNNSFSEPGVGGKSADIGPLLQGVSYNTSLQRFFGMTFQNENDLGFETTVSPDGVNWKTVQAPLIPTGTRWNDSLTFTNGYSQYASIVALDGSKNWSNSFYLYYTYVRPGDTWATRFMLRRLVTMQIGTAAVAGPQATTSLERYFSSSAGKHWVTTGLAIPKQGTWDFKDEGSLGGVFTLGGAGLVELDDCIYGTESYLVSAGGTCGSGATKLTTIGWVYSPATTPQPAGTHAIYRCSLSSSDDHFVSLDPNCEGATTEFLLGYAVSDF